MRTSHSWTSHQAACRFGIARRDITPPIGIYHRMWGAAMHDRAIGIHRPLEVSCLWLERDKRGAHDSGGSNYHAIVALDMCLLWAREMRALEQCVCRLADVKPQELCVTFSHTHAAGLMDVSRRDMPGGELIEDYLKLVAERTAEAVREARASSQSAEIVYGAGRCDLAQHREFWDERRAQFVCGLNPDGPADDTLAVAKFIDPQGAPLCIVVNYACHPTTLAWDNTLISPDFVGAMRETIEKGTGAPAIFLQGASGDLGPREGFVGDTSVADRNGRQLAYAVLSTLEGMPPTGEQYEYAGAVESGAVIGTWRYRPLNEAELARHRTWRCEHWTVDLQYREGLPTLDEARRQLQQCSEAERTLARSDDAAMARELRTRAELARRTVARLEGLPPGETFPLPVTMLQIGSAFWVFVEAEHYQILQRWLRARFPHSFILVTTLVGGTRPFYLPAAAAYGAGTYPATVTMVAPGSLEMLIDNISSHMSEWGAT